MNVPREAISAALLKLLQNNQTLASLCKTITRTPEIWTKVNEAQKPFITIFKGGPGTEQLSQTALGLEVYRIHYNVWIYVTTDPTGQTNGETVMNNILDAIDASVQSNPIGQAQTLGGLVTKTWIEGGIEMSREFEDDNIVCFLRVAVETGI